MYKKAGKSSEAGNRKRKFVRSTDEEADEANERYIVLKQATALAKLKERVYQEELASLKDELKRVNDEIHPRYLYSLTEMEEKVNCDRLIQNTNRVHSSNVRLCAAVKGEIVQKEIEVRKELISDIEERRRLIETERDNMASNVDIQETVVPIMKRLRKSDGLLKGDDLMLVRRLFLEDLMDTTVPKTRNHCRKLKNALSSHAFKPVLSSEVEGNSSAESSIEAGCSSKDKCYSKDASEPKAESKHKVSPKPKTESKPKANYECNFRTSIKAEDEVTPKTDFKPKVEFKLKAESTSKTAVQPEQGNTKNQNISKSFPEIKFMLDEKEIQEDLLLINKLSHTSANNVEECVEKCEEMPFIVKVQARKLYYDERCYRLGHPVIFERKDEGVEKKGHICTINRSDIWIKTGKNKFRVPITELKNKDLILKAVFP